MNVIFSVFLHRLIYCTEFHEKPLRTLRNKGPTIYKELGNHLAKNDYSHPHHLYACLFTMCT